FFTSGVTRVARSKHDPEGRPMYMRAAASAGNAHPLETYVVCGELAGVPAGLHHFDPFACALRTLRDRDVRGQLAQAAVDEAVASAPISVVISGVPWRTTWRYADRGLRHVYWDVGTALAQLLAVAAAAGLESRLLLGFVDAEVSHLVGVDGATEFPAAIVVL